MIILFLAFRNIFRYKKRLILNLLLVFFNTIFLIYSITIINTSRNTGKLSVINTITGHFALKPVENPDDLFEYISATKMKFFNNDDSIKIKETLDKIINTDSKKIYEAISNRIVFNGMIFTKERSTPCSVMGINPVEENNLSPDLSFNNHFIEPNSIITSSFIAKKLDLQTGDKVNIMNETVRGGSRAMSFIFRGIINPKILMDQNIQPLVIINIDQARYLLDLENRETSEIAVRLDNKYYKNRVLKKIKNNLDIVIKNKKIKLLRYHMQIDFLDSTLKSAYIMAYSEAAIFIIIMLVGLINITIINFRNQKKEIGTLIAMGLTPNKVFYYFLLQTLILITIGYISGFMLMTSIYYYLSNIFKDGISLASVEMLQYAYGGKIIYPKLDYPGMIIGYLLFIFSGFIAVSGICYKAAKIKITEALWENKI